MDGGAGEADTSSKILSLVGAATKGIGSYSSTKAQQSSLDYQASVADQNAQLEQDRASIALDNGVSNVQNQGLKTAQTKGMQTANLAANGVDLGTGSARDVLTSTQLMGQRDADQLQTNALREAWGYSTQAADTANNAAKLRTMAGNISPALSGASSLLGSASQVSSAWNRNDLATNGGAQ